MVRESFAGHNPSHFKVNSVVKAFIISETFLWSAHHFITPILSIFVARDVSGGNVKIAATTFSVFLIVRVIFELMSGRLLEGKNDRSKMLTTILGMSVITVGYASYALTQNITHLFISACITGIGLGIASPAKNALFSVHLDKNRETMEWGVRDSAVFGSMAVAAALGGFIADEYGFTTLFTAAAILNSIGIVPYILYLKKRRKTKVKS